MIDTKIITGKPSSLLITLAIPIFIGNLFQQIYSLVDRLIVGHYMGDLAFSALGATNAPTLFFMSILMGIAMGSGVVVAQYHGAKDEKNTANAIFNGLIINILIALITTIVAFFLTRPMLELLNTPEDIFQMAEEYMKVYFCGMVGVAAYYVPFNILRALGDVKTPLIFLIVCSILNVILDIVFIVYFDMGVAAVGLATVVSQFLSAIMCFIYAFKKIDLFRVGFKNKKLDMHLIKLTLLLGFPTALQYSLMYLSNTVLQRVVNGYGTVAVGAFSATCQVENIAVLPISAIGMALVTYVGQNVGAKEIERVKLGVISALKISTVYFVVTTILLWLFSSNVIAIFVDDPKTIMLGAKGIRITSLFLVINGIIIVLKSMLASAGDASYSVFSGAVEIIGRVVLAIVLTSIAFIDVYGIWITTGLTWSLIALTAVIRYKGNKWQTKAVV